MTGHSVKSLKAQLSADLRAAMLARDKRLVAVLRVVFAALDNAEAQAIEDRTRNLYRIDFASGAAEVARRAIEDDEVEAILAEEISARRAAARDMDSLGRADRAAELNAEADIVARYLSNEA
jgi:uncharacterized protein